VLERYNQATDNVEANGTQVKKKFCKHIFTGTITKYDSNAKLYFIEYSDGDCEEMTQREVNKYEDTANPHTIDRLKRRREKQQANETQQQTTIAPLPPHYAYAVWDEEENRMLEFRHIKTQLHERRGIQPEPTNMEG
jgi:hypothetical protein